MNLFNKTEAVGLFLSVAIMAVALSVIRFKTDILVSAPATSGTTQGAVVAVSQKEDDLKQALITASTAKGDLVKLVIDDVTVGTGPEVKEGDTLTVHYIGTTQDGVKFDSSYDRGQPFVFTVGEGKVITGWEEGLIGMKAGGNRILVIPPDMAYGNRQVGVIPPNSPLVFRVDLVKIEQVR
jgi:peptidylprolyl isomerase/FKBP-type peptidyl-prolyl cis-trans isomerase FkpA